MSGIVTVIPICTDEAMTKFKEACSLLRGVAADRIDLAKFAYFANAPIQIGNVQFMDCRNEDKDRRVEVDVSV